MWTNLLSSGEAAKERFTSALKETNDSLSQLASAHAQKVKSGSASTSPTAAATATARENPSTEDREAAKQSNTDQNEEKKVFAFPSFGVGGGGIPNITNMNQQKEILDSFKVGWGNVVEATKTAVETTREVVEKEQTRIQASLFANGPYVRDLSLPLDSDSLRDAEVVYLTDRLITMSHPAMQSPTNGDITPDRKLAAVAHLLQKRHGGKFMIWNLSELEYNYSILQDQVMAFQFPGSPSPPLGLMLKILLSVESWLKADERNVAVMHCLTGRGRTSTVMAAFLTWMGEAGFQEDPNKALEYIAHCKRMDAEALTIPSQRRYVSYFKNMMDGVRPSQPPILLKRVIMSEAPKFGRNFVQEDHNESKESTESLPEENQLGCSPYLQIFKAGKLVFTTAASKSYNQSKDDLPFCLPSEGSITFPIETIVQGDILIRCRHLTRKGQRVSMFRAAFHTGYIPPKVLRLSKTQLDGACSDKRYSDDFFIDLIFEECSAAMASKHLISSPEKGDDNSDHVKFSRDNVKTNDNVHNEAAARRMGATVAGSESIDGTTVTASAYDSMLHRDSRFWDVISERRENNRKKIVSSSPDKDGNISDVEALPFYGPTIGRRREFANEVKSEKSSTESSYQVSMSTHRSMQSFSIGGELDFTVEGDSKPTDEVSSSPKEVKKDDLMEALMAIDDDVDATDGDQQEDISEDLSDQGSEEIIFDDQTEGNDDLATDEEVSNEDIIETEKELLDDNQTEIEFSKSKQSSSDTSLVKVGDSDLDAGDSEHFDFDDDDDEELQDLEDFLTNAKS
mmetsp:Transcript_8857/g.13216  ORF Transcript_8857/g.13216 Transcript_8857/m.13216 type:complete len:795 (+) Transcript_8857:27-2411(+)